MNKWFLTAVGIWFFAIINHFALNLFESWEEISQQHKEEVNKRADCKNIHFAERYPTECDLIRLIKYKSFWTKWISTSIDRINWCGPVHCDDLFSLKGAFMCTVMLMFARSPDVYSRVKRIKF